MTHARQDLDRVGLDLHAPAAAVAALPPAQVGVDLLAQDGHARGQAVHDDGQSGTVRLAGSEKAQHGRNRGARIPWCQGTGLCDGRGCVTRRASSAPGAPLLCAAFPVVRVRKSPEREGRMESGRVALAGLLGRCPAMESLKREIARFGPSGLRVHVFGETGTGKEMVAKALHEASPRARRPLVPVNVAGFSDELFGSELFGHARGAFTGAVSRPRRPRGRGRGRDALHRRGRRHVGARAGAPPALPRGGGVPAPRRDGRAASRRAGDQRDERGPAAARAGGSLPPGPVVPAGRRGPVPAAPARARDGRAPPRAALPPRAGGRARGRAAGALAGRGGGAPRPLLARQRSGAPERDAQARRAGPRPDRSWSRTSRQRCRSAAPGGRGRCTRPCGSARPSSCRTRSSDTTGSSRAPPRSSASPARPSG